MKRQNSAEIDEANEPIRISESQIDADVTRVLTFASIFLLGLLVSSQLFPETPIGLGLKLIFFAFLVLALKNWISGMLLVLAQIPLFLVPQSRKWDPSLSGDEIILAFQLLLILALISRMHSPVGQPFSVMHTLKFLFGQNSEYTLPHDKGLQSAVTAGRNFAISTMVLSVVLLTITLITARFLQLVPMNQEFQANLKSWAKIEGWGFRLIVLGGLMFFCVLLTWLVAAEFSFRRLSVREASMYLRSQVVKWLHRDFRLIGRQFRRKKRKGS